MGPKSKPPRKKANHRENDRGNDSPYPYPDPEMVHRDYGENDDDYYTDYDPEAHPPPDYHRQRPEYPERPSPLQAPYPPYPPYPPVPPAPLHPRRRRRERSQKPAIGGALLIITGVMGIIFGAVLIPLGIFFHDNDPITMFSSGHAATIQGVVTDQQGRPLTNVTISVLETSISTVTNETGEYRLLAVPIGFREIKIEKPGYRTIIYQNFLQESEPVIPDRMADQVLINKANNTYNFILTPGEGTDRYGMQVNPMDWIWPGIAICATISLICSVFVLLGGIYARKRKKFGLAIVGAILGIFTLGFGIGSILAIIALFILLLARKEFKREEREREEEDEY